jgi:hypothetical protein
MNVAGSCAASSSSCVSSGERGAGRTAVTSISGTAVKRRIAQPTVSSVAPSAQCRSSSISISGP